MDNVSPNFGLISPWYSIEDEQRLIKMLKPGDLIEFSRFCGLYEHWAVFAGDCYSYSDSKSKEMYVINAAPASRLWLREKKEISPQPVTIEPLSTVWKKSKARINNFEDYKWAPFCVDEILARAETGFRQQKDYNLITNNCEHFAKWCRNGVKQSEEVKVGFTTTATFAFTLGAMYLAGAMTSVMKSAAAGDNIDGIIPNSAICAKEMNNNKRRKRNFYH